MASKYSQRALGIGCAGACGYVGAARSNIRVQQTQMPHKQKTVKFWSWNSVIPGAGFGGKWTYLSYFSTVANQKVKQFNAEKLTEYATNVPVIIQTRWSIPQDMLNEYSKYHPTYGFWMSSDSPEGTPFIVGQENTEFWIWFLQQLGYTFNLADTGNVGATRPNIRVQQTQMPLEDMPYNGGSQTGSKQRTVKFWTWNSIIPGSGFGGKWTYIDYYNTVLKQKGGIPHKSIEGIWGTPQDMLNEYSKYHSTQSVRGDIKGFWFPEPGPNGSPMIVIQSDNGFWNWILSKTYLTQDY